MLAKRLLVVTLLLMQSPSPVAAEEPAPSPVAEGAPAPVQPNERAVPAQPVEPEPSESAAPVQPIEPALEGGEPRAKWTESKAAGWLLIGSSLAVGAALSASGLSIDCGDDVECRTDASLLVWGGFGVASLGSMFGFVVLERAERAAAPHSPSGLTFSVRGHF